MSLLDQAKAMKLKTQPTPEKYSNEHIELVLAVLKGKVDRQQVCKVMGHNSNYAWMYNWIFKVLVNGLSTGRIKITIVKK